VFVIADVNVACYRSLDVIIISVEIKISDIANTYEIGTVYNVPTLMD